MKLLAIALKSRYLKPARAYAALDERTNVTLEDLQIVAPMALRQRKSEFINAYLSEQQKEDNKIQTVIGR